MVTSFLKAVPSLLDIQLLIVRSEILFISPNKMAYRPHSHLLLMLNSNCYFFHYSFLWLWNVVGNTLSLPIVYFCSDISI